MNSFDETIFKKEMQKRVSKLIREERWKSGITMRCLEATLGINQKEIQAWETGLVSPPANSFYRMMKLFGAESFRRAAELDMELQIEVTALRRLNLRQSFSKAA